MRYGVGAGWVVKGGGGACAALAFLRRMWANSFLEHPHIAKHSLRAALGVAAYQEADHAGGVGGVGVGGDDELAVDVEAELGAAGYDEEGVGGVVAALDGAGGGPVDEG